MSFVISFFVMLLGALLFRPATLIRTSESSPPRSAPSDTGVWFVGGITEKGLIVPTLVQSLTDFVAKFGTRVSYGTLYDAVETYFHEGGSKVYVSRVVGPAAVRSFVVLNDAAVVPTLRVEANAPGDWGNSLRIAVLAGDVGGDFKLQVSHSVDGILETSPSLADKPAAFAWAAASSYIVLVDQAPLTDPAVIAATPLAGGTDDRANAVDAHWLIALDRFTPDLGPGQVSFPGRSTGTAHTQLLAHAAANRRVAILDGPDTITVATLKAAAIAARTNGRYGAMFAPWVRIRGLTAGTVRTVSPSALVAGAIARSDALGSPNVPAAGVNGLARYVSDLSQGEWTAAQRDELNTSGVNVIRKLGIRGIRVYGWRSLVDPVVTPNWINFGNARLHMAIATLADEILEQFLFDQIDGRNVLFGDLKSALNGMLQEFYLEGSLYGTTPDQAYYVDVGAQVNTPQTIQNREVHAVVSYRDSPFAELVELTLVKRPITEAVA